MIDSLKLAVLMTVHNRKEKTLKCLHSLFSQDYDNSRWSIDVYLTDDGCTDGTREAIENHYPDVNIVDGDGNLYWNQGMRLAWLSAVHKCEFDAYLWLNDDTILENGAISRLLECYDLKPNSIIVGSTYSSVSQKITYGGRDENEQLIEPGIELIECKIFNGNIVLIPKSVFKKIGFLDKAYSHSLGDIDYGMTASIYGIKSYVCPAYCGVCESNPKPPKWLQMDLPFKERLNNLFSPLAYTNPREYFHYKKKHWGTTAAILAMVSIGIHFVSPKFWEKLKSK